LHHRGNFARREMRGEQVVLENLRPVIPGIGDRAQLGVERARDRDSGDGGLERGIGHGRLPIVAFGFLPRREAYHGPMLDKSKIVRD
jgi:hypothetical protein